MKDRSPGGKEFPEQVFIQLRQRQPLGAPAGTHHDTEVLLVDTMPLDVCFCPGAGDDPEGFVSHES